MLIIPTSDIYKVCIVITLIGAFILAKNYFPISIQKTSLEGRLQFDGNSFEMKDKIIAKYNAWVGFGLMILGAIIQLVALNLERHTTFADLKGRSVLFGSGLNTISTIAALFIILRIAIFVSDFCSRREYFPFLKDREKNNFESAIKKIHDTNPEMVKDAKRGINQQFLLFDIKIKKNASYDEKIQKLREEVFR